MSEEKKEVGRPTIMTPEIIRRLEDAFLMGYSDLEACFTAEIGKSTLYNYQNLNPEFVERKELLKNNVKCIAKATLKKGVETDPKLALAYLERTSKDEFSVRNEHTGKDGEKLQQSIKVNINYVGAGIKPESEHTS